MPELSASAHVRRQRCCEAGVCAEAGESVSANIDAAARLAAAPRKRRRPMSDVSFVAPASHLPHAPHQVCNARIPSSWISSMCERRDRCLRKSPRSSWICAAPRFSCSRWSFVVPGIGTIHGRLRQQPCQRDLRRRGVLLLGERLQPLDERQIRLPVFLGEPRNHVAEVSRVERRLLVDLAREESFAQRTERHEPDAQLLERRKHFPLRLTPPERVLALQRGHGLHGVCPTNGLHACLREPEVFDLAFANEVLDGAGDVFDRNVGIDAVLVEEVDPVGLESLQVTPPPLRGCGKAGCRDRFACRSRT